MSRLEQRVAENVANVQDTIAEAAKRAGRDANEITLIAVSKYVDIDVVEALLSAGCTTFGESRPQELWRKAEAFSDRAVHWHMIGHLQRNKVKRTLPLVQLTHSGDNLRLLEVVNQLASDAGTIANFLLEVNVSGDASKHGLAPDEVEPLFPTIAELKQIRICGLMAMAAWGSDPEEARVDFQALRSLRDRLAKVCPPDIGLDELSMGMSGDYEAAIEEGATMVRVGSALFEGIER